MQTLSELCTQYCREYLSDKSPKYRYVMHQFCAQVVRELGDVPLEALTPDVLRTWKLDLCRRLQPGSVHRYLVRLSGLLRVAVEEYGWLEAHPMKRLHKPSPGRGRVRFLTGEEQTRLLTACQESRCTYLYAWVLLALTTGGRYEEVRCLRWAQVDLAAGVVRFEQTKTDLDRAVPLVGETWRVVQAIRETAQTCWVFPGRDGTRPRSMEQAWRYARTRAGLENFRFHDLRHTYASYLAMSGATLREIADLLGHRHISMTMRYSHLLPSHAKGVVEHMLEKFIQEGRGKGPVS